MAGQPERSGSSKQAGPLECLRKVIGEISVKTLLVGDGESVMKGFRSGKVEAELAPNRIGGHQKDTMTSPQPLGIQRSEIFVDAAHPSGQ